MLTLSIDVQPVRFSMQGLPYLLAHTGSTLRTLCFKPSTERVAHHAEPELDLLRPWMDELVSGYALRCRREPHQVVGRAVLLQFGRRR